MKIGDREIETWYEYPALVPQEWVNLVQKLHPVTAIVLWEVLNNHLTPETISLAQTSPDWDRYALIRTVGSGNPAVCEEVTERARGEVEEIFEHLLPNFNARRKL